MAFGIDEDILRLHITICYAEMIMKELKNQDNLGRVETGSGFIKAFGPAQV